MSAPGGLRLIAGLTAGLLSLATAQATAVTDYTLPTYAQAYQPTTKDERGLWMEADESERVLRDSSLLMHDEKLNAYVKHVLCTEVGQERCAGVRVYIVEVPQFNASMAPNGTMRVWSGLLLRAQNEAQLAAILGHEFAHFELRHGVLGAKQARDAAGLAAWLTAAIGVGVNVGLMTSSTGGNVSNSIQLAAYGSIFKFSREQETAADLLSLKYTAQTQYDPMAASQIWNYIIAEADARSVARGLKPGHEYKSSFFATHPASPERASYLKAEAEKLGKSGEQRAQEYRDAIKPFLPLMLAAQVKSNDFGGTEYLLESLSKQEGWTGELLFQRGELYRLRASPRDLATATQFFREAIAKGYEDPVVHRELGLSLLRNGETGEGKQALQKYISLKPDATDLGVIKSLAN